MRTISLNFRQILANRAFIGALLFTASLYLLEEILFDFPLVSLYQIVMVFRPADEKATLIGSGLASLAFCFWFAWSALKGTRTWRLISGSLIALSSLVQYGFWRAVDRFMSSVDLQIALTTPYNTWKGAWTLYFNWRFVFPVLLFVIIVLAFKQDDSHRRSVFGPSALTFFVVAVNFAYVFTNQSLDLGPSVPSFYQTIIRFAFEETLPSSRESIAYVSSAAPQNNIVLVIDESIRGDRLSVNGYARETTPFLDRLALENDSVENWGLAAAGATCSHPSNALILTGARPGLDDFAQTERYPTLFQYASAMGYDTVYIDAQTNSFWNGLTADDVAFINLWIKADDLGDDIESDFRAADRIVQLVSEDVGHFIVLNKRGVHFLYEQSYPARETVWKPVPEQYTSQPELVTNSYDNGVRYNVNTFFERLLADPEILEATTILYTSDHGQTLFENGVS
ncbi:MAG: sulfatase-like hydrolase/transferase [Anaerolineales bacterium]|nr:sulfatase-like hydrolase/transferase [Anaerolineales bacterium]